MDNFEAIKDMDCAAMERFWDQVYLTGVNVGMYAASLCMCGACDSWSGRGEQR